MYDLEKAKEILFEKNYSLAIVKNGEVVFVSKERGIKPLLSVVLEKEEAIKGASLADKVIGKAAAMLCIKAGFRSIFADIVSENAVKVLKEYNIKYEYNTKVQYILNRDKSDMCPVEKIAQRHEDTVKLIENVKKFLQI
ncbi:hypothetical protein TR13x_08180 [Caloranaerobacter sp. TR13]|uniref:DUF1893 domain-containing protein n=1 Tax=Caloranaerobacter sp. TR13 TaxID=1302151 RepID=UPI0006D47508|nr:DUF1893 domain-containing protein [Caloranaerobacter sp. TR13]KPU26873.1 hypothetical protein TR13x_08180 [Caloranaerobacter sp. TR13]